ncbi:MAG: hypothetical protein JXA10_02085 [Anaerolineae bacterium]|nr:hypothetical protein [Anaerolineae bacterium]
MPAILAFSRIAILSLLSSTLLILTGCTLADSPDSSPIPITSTPDQIIATNHQPLTPTQTSDPTTLPDLRTAYGPFTDAAWVLDGVCFEALAQMNGASWSWGTTDALNTFFDQVDDSGWCDSPVSRPSFDFTDQMLVGTVHTAQGCDAAHRLIDVVQDDTAQTRILILALDVQSGCPYELAQIFLVAVPRLPDAYTTTIRLE